MSSAKVPVVPEFPADQDDGDILRLRELHGDVHARGGHHQVSLGSRADQPGQVNGGGAAVEKHGVSVGNARVSGPGDFRFFLQAYGFLFLVGKLPQRSAGAHRPSPGAADAALLLHGGEQLAHGNL